MEVSIQTIEGEEEGEEKEVEGKLGRIYVISFTSYALLYFKVKIFEDVSSFQLHYTYIAIEG